MQPILNDLDPETREMIVSLLPRNALEFVRLIGLEPALAMFSMFGGMDWCFSKGGNSLGRGAGTFKKMATVIGNENALLLAKHMGWEQVYIPRCQRVRNALRNRQIIADFDTLSKTQSGRETCNQLAMRYGTSIRYVEKIISSKPFPTHAKTPGEAAK